MKISKDKFERARQFVKTHARKLDCRLFEFEDGSADGVLAELTKYQNADGGFGHGIEPDFRLPASSPVATSVGLQYCVELNASADNPIVKSAIKYLLETYDHTAEYWPATFKDVNDAPHAPWWHVEEVKPRDEVGWANPSAELVGYLHRYSAHVPLDLLGHITKRARKNLDNQETFEGWYRYNILCWQRAMPYLPDDFRKAVYDKIRATYAKYPVNEENYGEVGVFWLAPMPDAILAQHFPQKVDELINAQLGQQADDGGWWPTWQWGQYEDMWEIAKREWAGKKTVEILRALSNYGRIEEAG